MPRDLALSNGVFLVNFDSHYQLRDIYYPHVGKSNHAYRCRSRLGTWVNGSLEWQESEGWELHLGYEENTLVTQVTAASKDLGVTLAARDAVDFNLNVLVRRIEVTNESHEVQNIRLFFHLDVSLWGTPVGNTAFYHPQRGALVAYKDNCYMLINGSREDHTGLDSWTTGHRDIDLGTGSWQGAESGELDRNPIAFGSVDCVGAIYLGDLQPNESKVAHCWLAIGESLNDVIELDKRTVERGPEYLLQRTADYWRAWVGKEFFDGSEPQDIPQDLRGLYKRSLLIVRSQTDHEGGIIAAADSNISSPYHSHGPSSTPVSDPFHGHEHYGYVWPRDGAMVAQALDRAGYSGLSRQFIRFCARVLSYDDENDQGYMLQRFSPDGAVASNVIPWVDDSGNARLPIQEDETALVLHLLLEHYRRYRDWELITPLYRTLIKPIGNFLRNYRDPRNNLPLPSQDLWEERDGVHAFTVATVWSGLRAASWFTEMFGERGLSEAYSRAAQEVKVATEKYLYDSDEGRFLRTIRVEPDGQIIGDKVVDASVYALFYFGMFDAADPRIRRTMDSVIERLTLNTPCGGFARYEGDVYQRVPNEKALAVPGNPWFICTLWVAQYYIQKATSLDELEPALEIIHWVRDRSLPSGVLAEQLDPFSCEPLGTSPLTWSHATLVQAILEYSTRYRELAT